MTQRVMRYLSLVLASLTLSCGDIAKTRPPVLGCDDGGCSAYPSLTGGPGASGGTDAGSRDAAGFDAGATVTVSGTLGVFTRFPSGSGALGATDGGAAGWTVTPVGLTEPVTMTNSMGRFTLEGVPTETFAGAAGRYYGLRARPVGINLGSYQLFAVGAGAANLQGITIEVLLNSVAPAGVTPDISRGHLVLFFLDSASPTARPVSGVSIDGFRDPVVSLYDNELGALSGSLTATGPIGVVAILNVATAPAESVNGHPFAFRATRAGRSATSTTLVFPQTVTWITMLPP